MRAFSSKERQRQTLSAPVRREIAPAGTYSDAQWRAIRKSLARIGIDADMITVTPDRAAHPLPLRKELQDLAHAFAVVQAQVQYRLSRQAIEDMRKALAALKDAHTIFARYGDIEGEKIDAEIVVLIAETQRRLDRFLANWGRRANARKIHVQFWSRISRVWEMIIAEQTPTRRPLRRDLFRFLRACSSASFAAAATDSALKNFLDRHRPQTKC